MLVAIVNHEQTEAALALRAAFSAVAETVLLDSGSRLSSEQAAGFDEVLGNVYWCGLLNRAFEIAREREASALYFIAADVTFPDCAEAVRRAMAALAEPRVALYAPSVTADSHGQMIRQEGGRLRPVGFTDGFAFAVKMGLLARLCPINTQLNAIGYGVDVHLGYLALRHGLTAVVDDGFTVAHPAGSGYSAEEAYRQQTRWQASELRWPARVFREVAPWPFVRAMGDAPHASTRAPLAAPPGAGAAP